MRISPAPSVFRKLLGISLLALTCAAPLQAQDTITFGFVSQTPWSVGLGEYDVTLGGVSYSDDNDPQNGLTFPAYNVTVTSGTGVGATLIGQNFLAICVNLHYPGLSPAEMDLSADGSSLSYAIPGNPNVWDAFRVQKYNAIIDIVAAFGSGLAAMPQDDDFQNRITALNFALTEIAVDGIAETDPLTNGNAQFRYRGGSELDGDVLGYFNDYMAAIGSGESGGYLLYAAGVTGETNQDVILIPVPEPTVALLGGMAGLAMLSRRRRTI
jgi:hypothetical protein